MDDLISRQAALDAIGEEPMVWSGKDEYEMGLNNQWHYDVRAIRSVPSAEPNVRSKTKTAEQFKEEALRAIKNLGGYPYNPDIYWAYRAVLDTPTYKEQGERKEDG